MDCAKRERGDDNSAAKNQEREPAGQRVLNAIGRVPGSLDWLNYDSFRNQRAIFGV